ncbi:MAG: acetoin utilization protein AcuC, partial [Zetaproteobacteria bacterium]
FWRFWPEAEALIARAKPRFFILQCGADSIAGDPLTHLRLTPAVHAEVARRVRIWADRYAEGRLLALGGGGYDLRNLAEAWCGVVRAWI